MNIKNSDFLVGIAKENITPELGCLLYGYPFERRAERVLDALTVGVVAIRQGEEMLLMISTDLCALNVGKCTEMRHEIASATGVKWENILYSTIHTHSGPVTRTNAGWGDADLEYINDILVPKSIKAANEALSSLRPAVMGIGISKTMTGINRRQIDENGDVILGQNPNGPYDPTMTLISFKTLTGENIGSIAHFAAHPTAAARNLSFTRDWPGYIVDKVEELTNAPCIYFNGAEGDVGPRLSNGRTAGGEEYIMEAGLIAAADIEKAYNNINGYEVPKLNIGYGNILLPFVEPPSRECVEEQIAEFEKDPDDIKGVKSSQYDQLKKVRAVYEAGDEFPCSRDVYQTIVALGELVIVPACFEVFCAIALKLRELSPYKYTILLGLTGGTLGYLPTEDQIPFGGYEVDTFRAIGVVSLVDDTDKRLINQNVEILKSMYSE